MSVTLTSIQSDSLISTQGHFRVSAGPGAGKTHWLVEHIKNVLQNSGKLGKTKKIACITYTNIAVETIVRRLDFVADRVEVATIHGFLYNHVVKPYVSFIASEFELDARKIDGHDEHFSSRQKIKEWLTNHPNVNIFSHPYTLFQLTRLEENMAALKNWIASISYELGTRGLEITADNGKATHLENGQTIRLAKVACLDKLAPGLLSYKKLFWKKGTIHHEDVLFFAYTLITRYPFILNILRAKFPYFFIDEFQDTNPIQTAIIKLLGHSEINIGVIGDKAQSIYKFQGAKMEHFSQFTLPDLSDYVIADNRRSTQLIITILNSIRKDFIQNPTRDEEGNKPILYVGDLNTTFEEAKSKCGQQIIATLSRDNITANSMKRKLNTSLPSDDMLEMILSADGNSERRKATVYCTYAVELARQKRFKEAIKEMEKNFRIITDRTERKKVAFLHLSFLLTQYDNYKSQPLLFFFQLIKDNILPNLAKFGKGAPQKFYSTCIYEQLAVCVNIKDDDSPNRTIHKAKGDEFDNVLVILKEESNLTFLLKPNLLSTELHRLFYVAVSRAKERLFISVPTLDQANERKLSSLFDIKRV